MPNPVPNGTKVRYHGSLTSYHGPMVVSSNHAPYPVALNSEDTVRYVLAYQVVEPMAGEPGLEVEWDYLTNVRPQSFTVIEENGHA